MMLLVGEIGRDNLPKYGRDNLCSMLNFSVNLKLFYIQSLLIHYQKFIWEVCGKFGYVNVETWMYPIDFKKK